MKQIQSMPDIWDDQPFVTSKSEILGALANWAVRQSPYSYPENLPKALFEFEYQFGCSDVYFETNCKELLQRIVDTFERCPTIMGWDVAKKGSVQTVFCSRHDNPHPDYDFIDLDALARNIAHSITLQNKYDQLHD